jgi:hypothetical protein
MMGRAMSHPIACSPSAFAAKISSARWLGWERLQCHRPLASEEQKKTGRSPLRCLLLRTCIGGFTFSRW